VLIADGFDAKCVVHLQDALKAAGAEAKLIAPRLGAIKGGDGSTVKADFSLLTAASVVFDALYLPGGTESVATLLGERAAIDFIGETFRHLKAIAATAQGVELLRQVPGVALGSAPKDGGDDKPIAPGEPHPGAPGAGGIPGVLVSGGGLTPELAETFTGLVAEHKFWTRLPKHW
jgi:catalase